MTVLLLLSFSFLGIAHAKKDNNYSAKRSVASKEKKSTPPKKKIAEGDAIRVLVTGYYTPVKGQNKYATKSFRGDMKRNGGGKTSSGKIPEEGMVATDPRVIPTGTEVYIPELELYAVAEDTGGDIKGKRIDVYTGSGEEGLKEALDIGNRMVTVIIIKRA
ncbi:MAG: 3D domain protein [Candidatus Moranbacteria bacterium GW2011_GWE1_35_17]|nr:MAG: 3D domain protein [Candidatus Moranbacteria bacterium GW2011_GWE1_35_17]KKP82755.1 MAG: 3D domain protein [Candidatus Moranbacteria bacterium GW2011_GWF1_35_5]